jgi:tetratricopeptide (TPR) repeat protein
MNDTTVTSINERAAEEYYRRGLEADKEGNHEKSVEFYERALNENPTMPGPSSFMSASAHRRRCISMP